MKLYFIKNTYLHVFSSLSLLILFSIITYFIVFDFNIFANVDTFPNTNIVNDEVEKNFKNIFSNNEKIAYLTFDDGPTKKSTIKILDILDKFNIKANFFVLGKHVEDYPNIIKREYEDGHFIANHGYSHNNSKLYKSKASFISEIQKTDNLIGSVLGIENFSCHIFRFPNGSMSKNYYTQKQNAIMYLDEIDYTYIDWNVVNNDSIKKYSKSQLLDNLKNSVRNKGTIVVLMHDTGDINNTYDILEDSIEYLIDQGYEFRTFYDLINR